MGGGLGSGVGISISSVGGGRARRDIDSALKFDLTESARKARLGLSRSVSATFCMAIKFSLKACESASKPIDCISGGETRYRRLGGRNASRSRLRR